MNIRQKLIAVADAFCAHSTMGRKRVSTLVLGRGAQLDLIAEGKADLMTRRFEAALCWFSDHWPADAVWPEGVERPVPAGATDAANAASDAEQAVAS